MTEKHIKVNCKFSTSHLINQLCEHVIMNGEPSLDMDFIKSEITKRREIGALSEKDEVKLLLMSFLSHDPDNIF
ncbi:MAG: hypothetical protein ABIJ05_05250 [Patescibacteria group bacterium]